ncbi:MAG: hypothetical protein GY842_23465 [bacterium]|nr:hypothetical protein [bacterium]
MSSWSERFKPSASRRTHLLLASFMWTVVGSLLFYFGARWVLRAGTTYPHLQIAAAAVVGVLKARLVLDRTARRVVERIRARGDGRCLGGFVSFRTWALILGMVLLGRVLRGGILPVHVVGLLYTAIGVALLYGSRNYWRAWHSERLTS